MDKLDQLRARVDANLADFQKAWGRKSKWSLICDAEEIAAVKDTHYYLTETHDFEPNEVEYLLQFENPLEVVSDQWLARKSDLSDFPFALDDVCRDQDAPRRYALAEKPSVLDKLRDSGSVPGVRPHTPAIEQEAR